MTVVYVREQGAMVRRDMEQLRVTQNGKVLTSMPVREVEQLVLCGNVQLTTQALALLLQHDVDVVFLSSYGKYRGRLTKMGAKFAQLRHAQLRLSGDADRSLVVGKKIVRAKLANQRNLMQELAGRVDKKSAAHAQLQEAATGIDRMRRDCTRAGDADTLRGYEGKAGVFYFGGVRALLHPGWSFQGRKYYPAPDPFNALLSFGYTLLLKDVTATIEVVGLDPYLGCFHALEYGRPSLALDLMEEFRPVVVDWTMLNLALRGELKPGDFTFTGRKDRPVELGPKLIPAVIKAYENRMHTVVKHTASGDNNTLRRCVELQARIFASVALGKRKEYEGLVV